MAEIIDGACLLLKERLAPVTFACPPVPPGLHVQGERVRFEQVLVNLMRNALEAMEGSPDPVLTLTLTEHGDMVTILIADNGPGIAPDLAERLFTPCHDPPGGAGPGAGDRARYRRGTGRHPATASGPGRRHICRHPAPRQTMMTR
jgi:two-component system C4-dicarboxylate transport sensor histidine kinase DctB